MSHDLDLLVVCELNPDVLVTSAGLEPRFGQVEQRVEDASIVLGSSGAITAAAAAAQGLRVAVCAVVGDDLAGDLARHRLGELGVDTSAVLVRPGRRTGLTVVLGRVDGDRAMLTFPGTMGELAATDVPETLLRATRHLHVSSCYLQTGLLPGLPRLLAAARAAGAGTSLDPGWDPEARWTPIAPALGAVDVLFPNAAECLAVAAALGQGPAIGDDLVTAAVGLARRGPQVVVKLGADGALAVAGERVVRCAAEPTEVVDTTGAGDNFDAGFLAARLDGADLAAASARAVASGSISLAGRGGTGRLASAAEALAAAGRLRVTATTTAARQPVRPPGRPDVHLAEEPV